MIYSELAQERGGWRVNDLRPQTPVDGSGQVLRHIAVELLAFLAQPKRAPLPCRKNGVADFVVDDCVKLGSVLPFWQNDND